ncbi:tRNA (N6-isopentenyl adenosine(37)-C2)-methylthiotransferase MiaB [Treponema pedis]|uniref:tRNA-2-methylthio-N(6)-dimethylallyladenosine synthase n=1 Tax=Treponema pedis str. T A4 TaxID=1291379 RepID=S6A914_9SPIR|nr:tRNA (N6-isopentenyl adenosine(37)-C2)-methylthiotransferase MiaB [Treponema pedis]AGT44784.1 (dimethylallyl)adenosine tRNA methylthiotransferase [Treponema pedis str. T A4]QSI05432.1 tRNA (N6-isopentenyl adenosine(37)-C2)-methylthiotransferase MiaB [Treponema pedis]
MTYFFETYGCQMNQAESSSMEQLLINSGWTSAPDAEHCDLLIINTCSVRITAENRVLGRLGHFSGLKKKRKFFVLLIGCMAERLYEEIQKEFPLVDYVVGMFERNLLPKIFDEIKIRVSDDDYLSEFKGKSIDEKPVSGYHFAQFSHSPNAFQSFVPIMNGCNNFCTYCIVPYVRGREVSRPVDEILNEIDILSRKGVREITLLGQNVNSYCGTVSRINGENGGNNTVDFPDLLRLIAKRAEEKDSIKWIRFMSSHPKDMSDKLIEVIASEPRVCKLVHLPVQHGSDKILKRMNRVYTIEHYKNRIKKLKETVPDLALSTDILMGFPGETEDDVEKTLSLMREIEFDSAFMYHYNPREGTRAFNFPDRIEESVKIERLGRVIDLQLKTTAKKMQKRLGKKLFVLVESHSRNNKEELFGHTEFGEMTVIENSFPNGLPESLIGNFALVELKEIKGKTFRARLIEED